MDCSCLECRGFRALAAIVKDYIWIIVILNDYIISYYSADVQFAHTESNPVLQLYALSSQ